MASDAFAGVDLAGVETRPTGLAVIRCGKATLSVVRLDSELTEQLSALKPRVVAIDAPLTRPPAGRAVRELDRVVMLLGFRLLPPGFPGMAKLTERGVRVRRALEALGVPVIEVHPLSIIRTLGLRGREDFLDFISGALEVEGLFNRHTIDSLAAAYAARLHDAGLTTVVRAVDGEMVLPLISVRGRHFRRVAQLRAVSGRWPRLAVDVVTLVDGKVVLIRRLNEPYKGCWALPGGFVEYGETVEQAAVREAKEETGLDVELVALVGVYSDPRRDPRGHVVSVAFLARARGGELRAASDAREVRAFPVDQLPERLAFDHSTILRDALRVARGTGLVK